MDNLGTRARFCAHLGTGVCGRHHDIVCRVGLMSDHVGPCQFRSARRALSFCSGLLWGMCIPSHKLRTMPQPLRSPSITVLRRAVLLQFNPITLISHLFPRHLGSRCPLCPQARLTTKSPWITGTACFPSTWSDFKGITKTIPVAVAAACTVKKSFFFFFGTVMFFVNPQTACLRARTVC